jgi:hypothetical protein
VSNIRERAEIALYAASIPGTYHLFELQEAVEFVKD